MQIKITVRPHLTPVRISSVQSLSRVRLFVTPWTAARQASISITNSWRFFKLMSIESVMSEDFTGYYTQKKFFSKEFFTNDAMF